MDNIKLICISCIVGYNNYIDKINKILYDISTNVLQMKNYKHNPLATDNIKNIEVKNDKMIIKYNGKPNQTVLFDYLENYRSFSLYDNVNDHIKLIKKQLTCEINIINLLYIQPIKNIVEKIDNKLELDNNNIFYINNYIYNCDNYYNLKDIYLEEKGENKYTYYISICPIYGFLLRKNKMYIANQYILKFEDNKYNIFYGNKHNFKRLLNRPNLKEFILNFNKNPRVINTTNVIQIIENIRSIITDFVIEDITSGQKIEYKLEEIDKPVVTKISENNYIN